MNQAEPYLQLLDFGLQQPYCDWGNWNATFDMTPPYILASRRIPRFLDVAVQYEMQEGNPETALAHLKRGLRFSEEIGQGTWLIAELVEFSEKVRLFRTGAKYLPSWERNYWTELAAFTDKYLLPHRSQVPAAYRYDMTSFLNHCEELLNEVESREAFANAIQKLGGDLSRNFEGVTSLEEMQDLVQKTRDQVPLILRLLAIDDPNDFQEQLKNFKKTNDPSPLLEMGVGLENLYRRKHAEETYALMLRAGIAVLLQGREVLEEFKEPGFNKPFLYRQITESAFELASHAGNEYPDKLVTLTFGDPPKLHEAAAQGNLELAEYYLNQQNLSVNSMDQKGWTPLHHAAANGRTEMVRFLLDNGASPSVTTTAARNWKRLRERYGVVRNQEDQASDDPQESPPAKTALELAQENNHQEVANLLQSALEE